MALSDLYPSDYDPGAPSASQAGPDQTATTQPQSFAQMIQGVPASPVDVRTPVVAPGAASMQPPGPPATPRVIDFPSAGSGAASAPPGAAAPSLAMMPGTGGARAAGFQPTTRSVEDKTAVNYAPETLGAIGGALGARGELAQATAAYGGAAGAAQAEMGKKLGFWDEATSAQDKIYRQGQLADLHDYHTKITGLLADAASDKTDPMKWFKDDMNTGQKIMFTLGSAIAGFGYGYTGRGINPAEVINGRIRASVDAQAKNHQTKLQNIEGVKTQYGQLKEIFGDEGQARLADEAAKRQAIVAHLSQVATDQATPYAQRMNAAKLAADLGNDQASTLKELDEKKAHSTATTSAEKYLPAQAAGAGGTVGVTVTLENGQRKVIPVALAKELGLTPGEALGAEKTRAEIGKTKADTAAVEAKAAAGKPGAATKQLTETAKDVKSTAYDPLRGIQGTAGFGQGLSNEDYNSQVITAWHASHPGIRLTPELIDRTVGSYIIKPGDTEGTVTQKKKLALAALGGGAAAVDAGEGAVEQ